MQSLLRVKLKRGNSGIEGLEAPETEILMDVITSALGTLCKSVNYQICQFFWWCIHFCHEWGGGGGGGGNVQ